MANNETKILDQSLKTKSPRTPLFWGNMGILFSGIAAGILIACVLLTSYALLVANDHLAHALAVLTNHYNEMKSSIVEVQNTARTVEQSMQQTTETVKLQAQNIVDLQKAQRTNKDDYLLAEAGYLVKLAQDGLQYERNIPLAIKLLQSADQDITKISDPKAYSIREAIAVDLAALQSAAQVDVIGVYAQLAGLNEQLDKLPLLLQMSNQSVQNSVSENDKHLPWWRRGLDSMKQALQRIVIVRQATPNIPPFIAPDQQVFFLQNLHAELGKAQWALLHAQQEIYRLSLQQAVQWIKQYAAQDAPVTRQLLQGLEQLQQVDIHPNMPDVTRSLQALQNYRH